MVIAFVEISKEYWAKYKMLQSQCHGFLANVTETNFGR